MENTQEQYQPTQEEIEQASIEWQRESLQKAQKHLAEKGVITATIVDKESRFIAPLCAIWKMKCQKGKTYWVISGRLPTDHVEVAAAPNAREALRHFSLQWQMKAEVIMSQPSVDKTQADFANLLIHRAQGIYRLFEDESLWVNAPK